MKTGKSVQSDLSQIRGVCIQTEQDLLRLGYPTVASLRGADPEELYRRDGTQRGFTIDRCQLYVYRCAVYYDSTPDPDPELLQWWRWKD